MLEQRRAIEKGYITLKEAAELTGYTSDYVGQLVRAGKIHGEQVYNGVAWVTTEADVISYVQQKGKEIAPSVAAPFFMRAWMKYFLYALIAVCVVFLLLLQYVFYVSLDARFQKHIISQSAVGVTALSP